MATWTFAGSAARKHALTVYFVRSEPAGCTESTVEVLSRGMGFAIYRDVLLTSKSGIGENP